MASGPPTCCAPAVSVQRWSATNPIRGAGRRGVASAAAGGVPDLARRTDFVGGEPVIQIAPSILAADLPPSGRPLPRRKRVGPT